MKLPVLLAFLSGSAGITSGHRLGRVALKPSGLTNTAVQSVKCELSTRGLSFARAEGDAAIPGNSGSTVSDIDHWYEEETRRIDEECREMRQKLQNDKQVLHEKHIEKVEKEVEQQAKRVQRARERADKERLEFEQAEEEQQRFVEVAAAEHKSSQMETQETEEAEGKVRRLQAKVAEKKKCLEELHDAELSLDKTKREIEDAKAELGTATFVKELARRNVKLGESKVATEEEHVLRAEEALHHAKRQAAKAEARFEQSGVPRRSALSVTSAATVIATTALTALGVAGLPL